MSKEPVESQGDREGELSSSRIAEELRIEILDERFAPGEWLRQDEIAARLGVSRLPVREGLRILAAEGLLRLLPNRGAQVPELARDEVNILYKMRERLEPLTLSEALPHITDQNLARMLAAQRDIEARPDVSTFMALDREFHMASYEACPSEHLRSTIERLWNATQAYRRAFMRLAGDRRNDLVIAEHSLILDAVRRRDPEDAEVLLRAHIRRTRIELSEHPEIFAR